MKSNHFINFLFVAGGKIFSLGALFVANIFIARLTGPIEFGYYSVALALIVLYDALIGAPLDNAVIRFSSFNKNHPDRVGKIQGDIFWFKVIMSLCFLSIGFYFLDELSTLVFNNPNQQGFLLLTLLSGTALVMTRSSSCYMQIHSLFKEYANIDAFQGFFRIAFVLVLFWLNINSSAAYLSIYGLSTFIVFIIFQFKIKQGFIFSGRSSSRDKKTMLSYIGVTSSIIILGTLTGRTDIPLISTLASPEQAGFYSAAAQIAMIGTLVASYIAIIFQAKLIEISKQGLLEALIFKNIIFVLVFSLLAIPVAIWLVPWLISFLFGDQFSLSIEVLQILIIGVCFDLMIMPILMPYAIQALPKIIVKGEILITILFFIAVLVQIEMNAVIMAWLVTKIRVLKFLLYFFSVRRHLHRKRQKVNT